MRSGLSQMRMANVRPPRMSARCTPSMRGEAGLDDAHEVIGDLVRLENVRGEAQVRGGKLGVGRLDVDDRHLGFGRQVIAHLVHLGADFRQRLVRIVIELEPGGDGGKAQRAAGLKIINAVGGGDGAFERRGDEPAHEVRAGADIDRGDGDRGVFAARVLPNVERIRMAWNPAIRITRLTTIASTGRRMKRSVKDFMRESKRLVTPADAGVSEVLGTSSLFSITAMPLRSLNKPALTMRSPGLSPDATLTKSPRACPVRMNCWRTTRPRPALFVPASIR